MVGILAVVWLRLRLLFEVTTQCERVSMLTRWSTSHWDDSVPHHRLCGAEQPAKQTRWSHVTLQLQLHGADIGRQLHLKRWQEVVVVAEVYELWSLKQKDQNKMSDWSYERLKCSWCLKCVHAETFRVRNNVIYYCPYVMCHWLRYFVRDKPSDWPTDSNSCLNRIKMTEDDFK